MKNYYQILGIEPNATPDEIKKAYRKLSLKFHPDKNPDDKYFETRFKEINEAYSILGNSQKKEVYDSELNEFDFINSDLKNAHDYLKQEADKLKAEREKFEREKNTSKVKDTPRSQPIKAEQKVNVSNKSKSNDSVAAIFLILAIFFVGYMILLNHEPKIQSYDEPYEPPIEVVDSASSPVGDFSNTEAFPNNVTNSNQIEEEKYYTIGSTKGEVIAIQGTPDEIKNLSALRKEIWYYGVWQDGKKYYSSITFKDNVVYDFDNGNEILKIRLDDKETYVENPQLSPTDTSGTFNP
jgi:DnaJ-domain-containing protein 1